MGKLILNSKGQSLLEVTITLGVAILIIVALTITTIQGLQSSQFSQAQVQATKYAQEGIEKIRLMKVSNTPIEITDTNGNIQEYYWYSSNNLIWSLSFGALKSFKFKTPCSNGTCRLIRLNAGDSPDYESLDNERLRRYIYIEDTGNQNQKKVTVEVKWTDSGGDHSSKLETILSNY
ncbi:MAG: hypothetical protein US86_C0005G0033 [Candidatus Daviesbacteria bacterium GW2011_GWA2_38_24]|uniref:Prepilin-type N-terminal cleavage/methylation domain-containing protein n=1 Tax=Candidatus Daviesbacteria bacterium GW2011_GWA2_38_24 TaxID=1618422 RepID=A0A0G0JI13_9BACT|nr:MAG: hypothetical protein US86_C0005G0033 [Candidatus Daviesbacteria bacterium GW2011_GWA2_38_24]KKQ78593.1 MAG: hypothetical protein UT01_C0065G0007 [Candidatus Daviesbacteria bacterium GW2011_GWA1_38_7]